MPPAHHLLRLAAFVSLLYSVAVLAIVATTPDVRLRCLLSGGDDGFVAIEDETPPSNQTPSPDATKRAISGVENDPDGRTVKGVVLRQVDASIAGGPRVGDLLVELADRRTPTFLDFSAALYSPKGATLEPGAYLNKTADPRRVDDPIWLVEQSGRRLVRARFRPLQDDGTFGSLREVWLPLRSAMPSRMAMAIGWLAVQGVVFALAWFAYLRRPDDEANRMFLVLSSTTLIAVVGGSHWWLLATRPWLAVPFLMAGIFLPAVLLHFVLRFPRSSGDRLTAGKRVAVYGPAGVVAGTVLALASLAWALDAGIATSTTAEQTVADQAPTEPMAPLTVEAVQSDLISRWIDWTLSRMRSIIAVYAFVAAAYYGVCLWLLMRAARTSRNLIEQRHARWFLTSAMVAAVPVLYTLYVALTDRSRLALGDAQLALFIVSLLLGIGYVAGLVALRRILLDEVADRGVVYALLSIGATTTLALTVAITSIVVSSGVVPAASSPFLATLTLTAAVLMAWWLRQRVQQAIDARFMAHKYRLDLGLAEWSGDPQPVVNSAEQLAARSLVSCEEMLDIETATFLLSADEIAEDAVEFRTLATLTGTEPTTVRIDAGDVRELAKLPLLQRAPDGREQWQRLLATLDAAAIQPIVADGRCIGLVAIGPKTSGEQFTPEDAVFLLALSQMTGVALQSAEVHQRLGRLSEELRSRVEQIDAQQRTIRELEGELAALARQDDLAAAGPSTDDPVFANIRGSSPAIREVIGTVRKVAGSEASVLIRGESGTGKELLARAIHDASDRSEGPLVSLHCAALSPSLMESELFGHVKGAFTDARGDKVGRFEQADGGTLFFDEVGDIPMPVQIKLLRVLQERRFERVGDTESRAVDVRVIAATHQNLEQLIAEGRFREDLYYRLNVVTVELPPLRERPSDVLELASHFLREFGGDRDVRFDAAAMAALESCDWPGNIRQLRNVVQRSLVMAEGGTITAADLPPTVRHPAPQPAAQPVATAVMDAEPSAPSPVDERDELIEALSASSGNKAAAAKRLGLPRSTFYSRLKKHGLA